MLAVPNSKAFPALFTFITWPAEPILVKPVPPNPVPIVEPCHVPVVIVPKVVILLVPEKVDKAVFSTFPNPTSAFTKLKSDFNSLVVLPSRPLAVKRAYSSSATSELSIFTILPLAIPESTVTVTVSVFPTDVVIPSPPVIVKVLPLEIVWFEPLSPANVKEVIPTLLAFPHSGIPPEPTFKIWLSLPIPILAKLLELFL